jgi:predicted kinase
MKKVFALSGLPGSGKTHLRTTNEKLKDLPCVDIKDFYTNKDISWALALNMLLNEVNTLLLNHDEIVIEALFMRGSAQRKWLEWEASKQGFKVEYSELDTPPDECRRRIMNGREEEIDVRLRILDSYVS